MKIAIIGAGYVGLSNAILLSQSNDVTVVDISENRVEQINIRESPFKDEDIKHYFKTKSLNLHATTNIDEALNGAGYVIVSTPTDYDHEKSHLDTASLKKILEHITSVNDKLTIVIKSTIPIGFVEEIRCSLDTENIIFSPEFLREGKSLHDNLYPSRIVVGEVSDRAQKFAELMRRASLNQNAEIILTNAREAEAIKLFSNTYLAMRVAFFNELDSFALAQNIDAKKIIDGVCLDPRIGAHYNNPSFGYGGYCLPKDTKQLLHDFHETPQKLVGSIIDSNAIRKDFIVSKILAKSPKSAGIYRLAMKTESDNFRESSVLDIIKQLGKLDVQIIIYEPMLENGEYHDFPIINDLQEFKGKSDIIIANRIDDEIRDEIGKVFSRDIFNLH